VAIDRDAAAIAAIRETAEQLRLPLRADIVDLESR
jgi:hypothetical protein